MNKKLLMFGLPLLAITLVMAGLIIHYAVINQQINVKNPIEVTGTTTTQIDGWANTEVSGSEIIIVKNIAPFDVKVDIDTTDNSNGNIETSYIGTLELTKKTVDFGNPIWDVLTEKVQIEYTVVGNEFNAEVTDNAEDGYVLIYYKDAETLRFDNPEKAIRLNEIVGNLPYAEDGNAEEYDYCSTGEYDTCHGAKIWYVPSSAIDSSGNIAWGQASEFYFESSLIQYNSDGQITIYPNEILDFTPLYKLGSIEGLYTVTTSIDPTE